MYPPYRYEAKELYDAMKVTKQVGGGGRNTYKDWVGERCPGLPSPESLAQGALSSP